MALFRKTATPGFGPAYDIQPANPERFGGLLAPVNFIRNVAQGACAGLLTLLGALHLTEGATPDSAGFAALTSLDATTLNSVVENLFSGGVPGIVEIIGAAVLFLNAGRGWAKILGLLAFIAIASAHANGVDHKELVEKAGELFELVQSTVHRFQVAQAAA